MKKLSFIMMLVKYFEILSHHDFVVEIIGNTGFIVALVFPVAWFVFFNYLCDPFAEVKETVKEAVPTTAKEAMVNRRDLFKATVAAFKEGYHEEV